MLEGHTEYHQPTVLGRQFHIAEAKGELFVEAAVSQLEFHHCVRADGWSGSGECLSHAPASPQPT